ncbi:MAG: YraN family protein, partial [Planctomycetaceae bacterium]
MSGFVRRWLGNRGEKAAARYLRRKGLRILARQFETRWGELDL